MRARRLLALVVSSAIFVIGVQSPASAGNKKKVVVLKKVKITDNDIASGNCVSVLAPPCP